MPLSLSQKLPLSSSSSLISLGACCLQLVAIFGSLGSTHPAYSDELARAKISAATTDAAGVHSHQVVSPLQAGPTEIRVMMSPGVSSSDKAPVVYLLPVEANRESRYGDPIRELLDKKLAERHRAIYVAPTFAHLPWYANHPHRDDLQQEKYFVEVVVPFIERTYPAITERRGRLLVGFSKSGWGAWTLLLRNPDLFDRAGAFDAPMMLDRPGKYGSGEIFGDQDNFAKYHVHSLLAERRGDLRTVDPPRLLLIGVGNFASEHTQIKRRLAELEIPLAAHDPARRPHDWHSGWVADLLDQLLPLRKLPLAPPKQPRP